MQEILARMGKRICMLEDKTENLNMENQSYDDPTTEPKRDISNDDLVVDLCNGKTSV